MLSFGVSDHHASAKWTGLRLVEWTGLGALVGVASGLASALFLASLERATEFRDAHEYLVYALPLAGLVIGLVYERLGKPIRGGNNLVIDTIHDDDARRSRSRMAPMVLVGTVLTHLFGGSAGREGTAVQMGASLADAIAHRFRVEPVRRAASSSRRASPAASARSSARRSPAPSSASRSSCSAASSTTRSSRRSSRRVVGDLVTRALGIVHTAYPHARARRADAARLRQVALIGVAMAVVTIAFVELTHRLKDVLEKRIAAAARCACSSAASPSSSLWKLVGTSDYLGLGVPMIVRSFTDPNLPWFAFARSSSSRRSR